MRSSLLGRIWWRHFETFWQLQEVGPGRLLESGTWGHLTPALLSLVASTSLMFCFSIHPSQQCQWLWSYNLVDKGCGPASSLFWLIPTAPVDQVRFWSLRFKSHSVLFIFYSHTYTLGFKTTRELRKNRIALPQHSPISIIQTSVAYWINALKAVDKKWL